jgi:hypothetical protein
MSRYFVVHTSNNYVHTAALDDSAAIRAFAHARHGRARLSAHISQQFENAID